MDSFVKIPDYPFVICKSCQYSCVADEVKSHLKRQHGMKSPSERARISEAVRLIPNIIRDQAGLREFQLPPPTVDPIPFIEAPQSDGLRCRQCPYVSRTVQRIREHCQREHGWQSNWKKGGNVAARAREERQLPWATGIQCQRFFRSRVASSWFEVGRLREDTEVGQIPSGSDRG